MFTLDTTVESHFQTLAQENAAPQVGILIGTGTHVLLFLPLVSSQLTTLPSSLPLAGGLQMIGLYSFTSASSANQDHLPRLQTLTTTVPRPGPWLLLLHSSNKLSPYTVASSSSGAAVVPAKIRFQPNLKEEYHRFNAQIPLTARATSPTQIELSIRTVLDKRRAVLTIDSCTVPRPCLSTLTVGQIKEYPIVKQDGQTLHRASLQMVQPGVPVTQSSLDAWDPVLSATIVSNQFNSISFVHRSVKLMAIVDTLIEHVVRQVHDQLKQPLHGKGASSRITYLEHFFEKEYLEHAIKSKYIAIPSAHNNIAISTNNSAWASLQPATGTVQVAAQTGTSPPPAAVQKRQAPTQHSPSPGVHTVETKSTIFVDKKKNKNAAPVPATTTTQDMPSTSPAIAVLIVGVVLVAIVLKCVL